MRTPAAYDVTAAVSNGAGIRHTLMPATARVFDRTCQLGAARRPASGTARTPGACWRTLPSPCATCRTA